MEVVVAKNATIRKLFTNPVLAPTRWVLGKLYVFCFMGYCLAPFSFFSDYWAIYKSVYFMGFVFFLGWRVVAPFVMPKLLGRSRRGTSTSNAPETPSVDGSTAHPLASLDRTKNDWMNRKIKKKTHLVRDLSFSPNLKFSTLFAFCTQHSLSLPLIFFFLLIYRCCEWK